jgi:hypothetical protein
MGAMLGFAALVLIMGLSGCFTRTCRHIALVQLLRIAVVPLLRSIGHSGKGSSAGFGELNGPMPLYV